MRNDAMHIHFRILSIAITALFAVSIQAQAPTNSLEFHLQSLGRTATKDEREVIEAVLALMQRYEVRTDCHVASIRRDATAKEWALVFDGRRPDAGFTIFVRGKDADWFEMQAPLLKGRNRFPSPGVSLSFLSQAPVPTNSLAFHLQSLGRRPTKHEREVIEAVLPLMQRHWVRTDFPLTSIRRDAKAKEWVLVFDTRHPDVAFTIFVRSKDADRFEMQLPSKEWRFRFP